MANYHGRDAKVTINGVEVCVTDSSVTESVNEQEVTTTCSLGFMEYIVGLQNAEWSFSALYNPDEQTESGGALENVAVGDVVALQFFANRDTALPAYDMPTALITGINYTQNVNDLITVEISGQSNGEYAVKSEVSA